jgi:hypothetical protein
MPTVPTVVQPASTNRRSRLPHRCGTSCGKVAILRSVATGGQAGHPRPRGTPRNASATAPTRSSPASERARLGGCSAPAARSGVTAARPKPCGDQFLTVLGRRPGITVSRDRTGQSARLKQDRWPNGVAPYSAICSYLGLGCCGGAHAAWLAEGRSCVSPGIGRMRSMPGRAGLLTRPLTNVHTRVRRAVVCRAGLR